MERPVEFEVGNFYHIFNRGVEKRNIFNDDRDKERFQSLLYLANGTNRVVFKLIKNDVFQRDRGELYTSIIAYSLMSNHFHIVAKETKEGGITAIMKKLSTAYSMYFNTKNDRTGALVCRPFRAKHIGSDDYFRWVLSYVHLNPLDLTAHNWKNRGIADKSHALRFLTSYPFSSYLDYFGHARQQGKIIDKDALPISVSDLEDFDTMLQEFTDAYERPDLVIW